MRTTCPEDGGSRPSPARVAPGAGPPSSLNSPLESKRPAEGGKAEKQVLPLGSISQEQPGAATSGGTQEYPVLLLACL